jgi:hypothetical protein
VVTQIANALRFALAEFGPLIVFLLLSSRFDIKVAIAGTVIFIVVDGARPVHADLCADQRAHRSLWHY